MFSASLTIEIFMINKMCSLLYFIDNCIYKQSYVCTHMWLDIALEIPGVYTHTHTHTHTELLENSRHSWNTYYASYTQLMKTGR